MMYGGFGLFDAVFPVLFMAVFAIVLGGFVLVFARALGQWRRDSASPRLTVPAKVVAKRADVRGHRHHHAGSMAMSHTHTSTSYYAAFEVDSGDRLELRLSGEEYGLLAEGDRGMLSFQGSRFLGFARGAEP